MYSVSQQENSICSNADESTYYTNQSISSSHNKSVQRVSPLQLIMQQGYVKPPTTVVKPFNLSKSNMKSKYDKSIDQPQPSNFKAKRPPRFDKPFIIYKSNKPLTIPKEPPLSTGR